MQIRGSRLIHGRFLPKPKPPPGSSLCGPTDSILTGLQARQNLRGLAELQEEVQYGVVEVGIEELVEEHREAEGRSGTEGEEEEEEHEVVLAGAVQRHEVVFEVVDRNNQARRYGARGVAILQQPGTALGEKMNSTIYF